MKNASKIKKQNKSLENAKNKCIIRNQIGGQIEEWQEHVKTGINAITLCGATAQFEANLIDRFAHGRMSRYSIPVAFSCVENDKAVFPFASKNLPENCTVTLCNLRDFLNFNAITRRGNTMQLTSKIMHRQTNMLWMDYCTSPTPEKIRDFVAALRDNMTDGGLAYVTFCIHGRQVGKEHLVNALAKEFPCVKKGMSLKNAVLASLRYEMILKSVYKDAWCIYKVNYQGGAGEKMCMISIGYAYKVKASHTPTRIFLDHSKMERTRKQKNANAAFFAMHNIEAFKPIKLKEVKSQTNRSGKRGRPAMSIKEKAVAWLKKGMTTHAIANKLNVSVSKIGAYKAWITMRNANAC